MNEVSLRTVTIPDGVVKICRQAFYNCTNLKSVSIPASVKEIEAGAFIRDNSGILILVLNVEGENNWNGYARLYTSSTSSTPNALVFTGKLDGSQLSYPGDHRLDPSNKPYPKYSNDDVTYKRN